MTHYKTLDVEQDADIKTIKQAYKRKAFKLHPDRNPNNTAKKEYTAVQDAYDMLSNKQSRARYDLSLRGGEGRNTYNTYSDEAYNNYHDIDELLRRAKYTGWNSPKPTVLTAKITLEEAFSGCKRDHNGQLINIPAGVIDGTRLKVSDLTIIITILPHKTYRVDKVALYANVYIDAIQAMVGIDLIVNHPNGTKLKTKMIPPIQEGQRLKLTGKGLDSATSGLGDLFIFCHIIVPGLTSTERDGIVGLLNSTSTEI